MSEAEQWLYLHTGRCVRMQAFITDDQCDKNRGRGCLSCAGCAGLDMAQRPQASAPGGAGMASKKSVRECVGCHEVKEINGRGLCSSCYHAAKKAGEFDKPVGVEPIQAENVADITTPVLTDADLDQFESSPLDKLLLPGSTVMVLDFSEQAEIFEALRVRDIDAGQVIELLGMLLDRKLMRVAA